MSKTIILLLSTLVPVGAWAAASSTMGPSRLILQVVCAVAASFFIFIGVLRATERSSWSRRRGIRRPRRSPALALRPPLPLQARQPSYWQRPERYAQVTARRSSLSA